MRSSTARWKILPSGSQFSTRIAPVASARRKANGSKGGHIFRNANDPHETNMVFEWDAEKSDQYMQSPGLAAAMQQAGVVGQPDVSFLEEVEDSDK